ncbi:hypothetical protein, partial [Altericroceibacterium xinjiangense]|uniref:hypothetical protein n=1 Tax=Altericroceibacterium xinjiangense TaxID=762261 RepID=UPI0019D186A0
MNRFAGQAAALGASRAATGGHQVTCPKINRTWFGSLHFEQFHLAMSLNFMRFRTRIGRVSTEAQPLQLTFAPEGSKLKPSSVFRAIQLQLHCELMQVTSCPDGLVLQLRLFSHLSVACRSDCLVGSSPSRPG